MNVVSIVKRINPVGLIRLYGRLFYAGNRVKCPICGAKYREFGAYGVRRRRNALCFNCLTLERHRLLWIYLQQCTALFDTATPIKKIQHYAPEKALYDRFSRMPNIDYRPCDLHPELYRHHRGAEVVRVDITNILYADDTFDVILCNHVLEHIPDDGRAMRELRRVLKPDGWAILQVPLDLERERTYEDPTITSPRERERAFGQYDHVRWYGRDYADRLRAAGFEVTEDNWAFGLSAEEVARWGLVPETIYVCRKSEQSVAAE